MARTIKQYGERIKEVKDRLYQIINNYSDEPVSYEGCDTLVVLTVQGFLGKNKHEDLNWWSFLALRREAPTSTRSKTAARYDRQYFIPFSEYKRQTVNPELFRRVVFAYFSTGTSDNEEERLWLKEKAEQGYPVISSSFLCFQGKDGMDRYEKNSFYLPVNALYEKITEINYDQFYDLLAFSNTYSRLQFYGNIGLQRSEYIITKLNAMSGNIEPMTQFYNMIKICEYCIHMQALKSLCSVGELSEKTNQKLIMPPLGTMSGLQNVSAMIEDADLAEKARRLDMMLSGKSSSPLRKTKVSYLQLCDLIVRLRNRYLGHGVMSDQVTFELMEPLCAVMTCIVNTFVSSQRLEDTDCLPSPIGSDPVPALRIHNKETYYFCGYYTKEDQWYADYLCFKLGQSLRYRLDDMKKPVLIPEETAFETENPENAPEFIRTTELSRDYQKSIGRFAQQMKYLPLVYDYLGGDYADSLYGTNHYSDFSMNLCAFYDTPYSDQMSYDEKHLMYLKAPHPMYLLQVDRAFLENVKWTDEEFAEKAYLGMIVNGLLLPECRCVMVLVGTDPDKVKNPYPWIRNTEAAGFETEQDYENWRASFSTGMMYQIIRNIMDQVTENTSNKDVLRTIGMEYKYRGQSALYEKLLIEYECGSVLMNPLNIYFAGMFKNALDAPNLEFSFIALFDFIEFAMLSVVYWAGGKTNTVFKAPDLLTNFTVAAQLIEHYGSEYDIEEFKNIKSRRIPVSGKLRSLHEKCTKYLPVRFKGSEIDFMSTCAILRYLRNRTKGHGFVQPFNASDLWELTMHYTMALTRFLRLDSFDMYISNGAVYLAYEDHETSYSPFSFFEMEGNMPCPLILQNEKYDIFQNYFTGKKLKRKRNIPAEEQQN